MSNPAHLANLTPEAVREVLRDRRKGRKLRSCFPCKQRKVKCDDSRPCKTCIARGHENLCLYNPYKLSNTAVTHHSPPKQGTSFQTKSHSIHPALQSEDVSPDPTLAKSNLLSELHRSHGSETHLGEQSIPSFVQEQINDGSHLATPQATDLGQDIMPMLGLQSPAWQHFLDLENGDQYGEKDYGVLPGRDKILESVLDVFINF